MFLGTICAPEMALAQLGPRAPAASTSTATQLPLSGRSANSGSVATTQTPIPGATTSVNTINSTVQVSGAAAGSEPSVPSMPFTGKLSFKDAIRRAIEFNLGTTGQATAVLQARGQSKVARSQLLPNLTSAFSEHYLTTDLATTGIQGAIQGAVGVRFPIHLPTVVGPIQYYDLRATLTQNFLDLTLLNNYRSAKETVRANEASMEDARDTVVLAVAASYLQVIAAKARLASERAQLETAESVYKQTAQQHASGLSARSDLDQDLVRAQTERQRLATMENDLARQKINLARLTGLPPNNKCDISDDFDYSPAPVLSVDEAVAQALSGRADLRAAEAQLRAAERTRTAARAERLPSLSASADYGEIGAQFNQGRSTYTVTGTLSIPIWQGGRAGGGGASSASRGAGRHARPDRERCSQRLPGPGSRREPGRVVKEQSPGSAGESAAHQGEVRIGGFEFGGGEPGAAGDGFGGPGLHHGAVCA
jgi:outer membrane protein TolC